MNRKLTNDQIKEIQNLYYEQNISPKEIVKRYPINFNHVQRVCAPVKPENMHLRSFKAHARKLDEYEVKKILIERMRYGTTQRVLAEKYKVSATTISYILRGINWKHIWQKHRNKYKTEILSIRPITK